MTALSVAGVTKAFGANQVLHGVDLVVSDGSLTAILGSSGSGKTTLLRIIAGFERADAGTVRLGDTTVDGPSDFVAAEKRGIGYVPQEGVLFPHLSVLGNVAFGLPRADRHSDRVRELVDMVGLEGFEHRYPHQLSGGQQQRVALARALAVSPALVLLDEPFAALDAGLRATVRADVRQIIRTAGTTAILVTHDQDEALSMADDVAVLRDGLIVQHGSPATLYRRPTDPMVAAFVGEANLLAGTVHGSVATTALGDLPVQDGAIDGPATVLVRPEQIQLSAPAAASSSPGPPSRRGQRGHIIGCEYYGHDAMLRIAWTGSSEPLLVRVKGVHVPSVGDEVGLSAMGRVTAWPANADGH